MTIRAHQMQALQSAAFDGFVQRLIAHLLKHHGDALVPAPHGQGTPLQALTPEARAAWVRQGITRARSHGLSWASSLTTFVALLLVMGPDFDSLPLLRAILDAKLGEREKMSALVSLPNAADWQAASALDPATSGLRPGADGA